MRIKKKKRVDRREKKAPWMKQKKKNKKNKWVEEKKKSFEGLKTLLNCVIFKMWCDVHIIICVKSWEFITLFIKNLINELTNVIHVNDLKL